MVEHPEHLGQSGAAASRGRSKLASKYYPERKDSVADNQDSCSTIECMLMLRVFLHVAIFAAALLVFTLGLGIGLALNPAVGTLLWMVAVLIAVANAVWVVRDLRRR